MNDINQLLEDKITEKHAHAKCILGWNNDELSWDQPSQGFTPEGKIIKESTRIEK
jgi:hypothetical protein